MSKSKMSINKVDIVFVVGKDNPGQQDAQDAIQNFIKDCQNKGLTYAIIGDGKTEPSVDEIKFLPQSDNLVIWGHGGINPVTKEHNTALFKETDNSQQIIKMLQEQTAAKNIVGLSCFADKLLRTLKKSLPVKVLSQVPICISLHLKMKFLSWEKILM